jgi:hypothetical protein
MEEERVQRDAETENRKQYVAPVLVEYGNIRKLTLNNMGSMTDGSGLRNGGA